MQRKGRSVWVQKEGRAGGAPGSGGASPAPDIGGSSAQPEGGGGNDESRVEREGPNYLEGRRLITMNVDTYDPIQTLYDDVVAYLKGLDKGVFQRILDNGGQEDIPVTVASDGEFDHFWIKLVSSSFVSRQLVLWIKLPNLYIVGFRRIIDGEWFGTWQEFDHKDPTGKFQAPNLIHESTRLSFGNSYPSMYEAIKQTQLPKKERYYKSQQFHAKLPIGRNCLLEAIGVLTEESFSQPRAALSLMHLSTMICETLRFLIYLAQLKESFRNNEQIYFGKKNLRLVSMWASGSKVFDFAYHKPNDRRLRPIKDLMPRRNEILDTILEEIGILMRCDTASLSYDKVLKFVDKFKSDFVFLKKARSGQDTLLRS